ncbi:MAG TPA: L-threonylcarbamoyladenylate synthase [Labilithrix sp.]|jgi:tRNA threonylcarbamoyl adenosine modification protein (Sua5/YciO/YrdC/YwlC family)|nr:L-threonylcarbamoyladenylate synthase [Labilithrix sp.]
MLVQVNPLHPEPRKIQRAVDAVLAGEVIGYPTDTVYGLGCDIANKKAADRLYQIKGMDRSQSLAFICPDLSEIAKYAIVDNQIYRVLKRFLPGPYCFILEATREVPRLLQTKRKTIGIRVPDHEVVRSLVRGLGRPIISTTAQRDDSEPYVDPHEIDADFRGLGLVLDGGAGGVVPTTVVDLTVQPPAVLRQGAGGVDEFVDDAPRSLRGMQVAMRQLKEDRS